MVPSLDPVEAEAEVEVVEAEAIEVYLSVLGMMMTLGSVYSLVKIEGWNQVRILMKPLALFST